MPQTAKVTSILGFEFGAGRDFAVTPPELARRIDEVIRRQLELRIAIEMACDEHDSLSEWAWGGVLDARDRLIFEGGSLWSWFSFDPSRRHFAYHHSSHVLFWEWGGTHYTLVNEAGERACGRCLGAGRYRDGACEPCKGLGIVETVAWVPAAVAARKEATS